jgi:hypothetical protein
MNSNHNNLRRNLMLPLGSTTTDTLCGNCKRQGVDAGVYGSGYPTCRVYDQVLDVLKASSGYGPPNPVLRCKDCIEAEIG